MNQEFIKIANDKGQAGINWLNSLPKIIDQLETKWKIKIEKPFANLTYNYAAPAKLENGTSVVIKIGFPNDKEFIIEMNALIIFNGEGIAKLLEHDKENFAMLLERLEPGTTLSKLKDDEKLQRLLPRL
jgi:streptomycin 6-kinase